MGIAGRTLRKPVDSESPCSDLSSWRYRRLLAMRLCDRSTRSGDRVLVVLATTVRCCRTAVNPGFEPFFRSHSVVGTRFCRHFPIYLRSYDCTISLRRTASDSSDSSGVTGRPTAVVRRSAPKTDSKRRTGYPTVVRFRRWRTRGEVSLETNPRSPQPPVTPVSSSHRPPLPPRDLVFERSVSLKPFDVLDDGLR